ncbi:MAG: glycosyltransferase [Actinomycetota bacterium]
MSDLQLSIIVPTFHRPDLLERCLQLLIPQVDGLEGGGEIIVVNDGGALQLVDALTHPTIRILESHGVGPGRARNLGIGEARGEILAFTDDDATVARNWVATLLSEFDATPEAVGVRGVVQSVPFDPLFEHSVEDSTGGGYLTCNVAYRASAIRAIGGFDPAFRRAHEDRDLGYRIGRLGPVLFSRDMIVDHPPRPFTAREWWLRGRFVSDDWLLYARYADQRRGKLPLRLAPLEGIVRRWLGFARDPEVLRGSPRRLGRVMVLGVGQFILGLITTFSQPYKVITRSPVPRSGDDTSLRVAFVGPVPNAFAGGAPGVAGLLFRELVSRGATIDCYLPISSESDAATGVEQEPGVTVHRVPSSFQFGRWYSSHPLSKMMSAQIATALGRVRAGRLLRSDHEDTPYDVLYQFSTIELFGLPRRAALPPIASHPSVHAAGELRWLRRESGLARQCQGVLRPMLVRAWVRTRAVRQKRDIGRADAVLAISPRFGELLSEDCGVPSSRVTVVPNVIDVDLFAVEPGDRTPGPLRVLVLGRVTVRKGLDDLIAASQLLSDLEGRLMISVVGDHSLWSDYRPLLEGLNQKVAAYVGHRPRTDVALMLRQADLLLQASHYEPFGLTVAEALASGVFVVATSEVGAGNGLPSDVIRIVPPSDAEELARTLRELVQSFENETSSQRASRRAACRAAAIEHFSPATGGVLLDAALRAVAGRRPVAHE